MELPSSTWYDAGIFSINGDGVSLEANLGYSQRAQFGLDTLGVGLVNGSSGPTLENQTIALESPASPASPFYLYESQAELLHRQTNLYVSIVDSLA